MKTEFGSGADQQKWKPLGRPPKRKRSLPVQTGNERVGMHMDLIEIKKIIS